MTPSEPIPDKVPGPVAAERDLYVLTPVSLGISGTSALRGAAALLSRYRSIIGAVLFVFLAAGVAFSMLATPVYRAEVTLAPAYPQGEGGGPGVMSGQFGTLAALAGFGGLGGSSTQEAVAVLESRAFTADFIRERNLLPVLFPDGWYADTETWQLPENEVPKVADGVRLFQESLRRVATNLDTGLVTLSIEWSDPALAAGWANDLVARLNDTLRQREIVDASRSLEYLHEQISRSEVLEVRGALFALVEEQEKRRMLASVNQQYAFRVLDPAVAPEVDDPVRPRPVVVILMAAIIGVFVGFGTALMIELTGATFLRRMHTH